MLGEYNPVDIELALHDAGLPSLFPPCSDRKSWERLLAQLDERAISALFAEAELYAGMQVPSLPATLYLEVQRNGQREGYEGPMGERRQMLAALTIVECLEDQGRFLDAVMDVAWAICEESSWAYPAHQQALTDIHHPIIDLGAAMTVLNLAEMDQLLGERLDPLLGKRVRDEANWRIFTPYLNRHDHWWLYNSRVRNVNNWTAVCNCGVAGAALYLESDLSRLGEIVARAARSMDDYLNTFDSDGGSSEGPGYWDYGFGYYTILADLVERRTGGEVNFWAGPQLRQIASYPLHTVLSSGQYANFSDCDADVRFSRAHLSYLAQRLDIPDLARLALEQPAQSRRQDLCWLLRDLMWAPDDGVVEQFSPAPRDWFGGMMWMVARYDPDDSQALVLAVKGGHNGEMHNQNDVGNFIVHVNHESIVPDLGRGRYTKAYFGPERYDYLVNSSLGHSVPVPNEQLQEEGPEYAAELVEHVTTDAEDRLVLELRSVYPEAAKLSSLRRTISLHREAPRGWVEVVDSATFAGEQGRLESALMTFGEVEIGDYGLVIHGNYGAVRVTYDGEVVDARVDLFKDVDLAKAPRDVRRIVFSWKEPAIFGDIRLEIVPVP